MEILISESKVAELKTWFRNYVHTFQYKDPEVQQNIDLKEAHTLRVCKEILTIGQKLGLNNDRLRLAEIIALFHDIGRFEQYDQYRTFADKKSVNHAELGIKILEKSDLLESFTKPVKEIILRSISYHNRATIPRDETEICLFYAKLIRDADKLDIWKVVTDYYYRKDSKRNETIELDLPDTPGFSENVYHDLMNKRIVDIKHIKNLNDFKLLQVGWIFDINFKPTLNRVNECGYLELIRGVLPESKKIDELFELIYILNDGPGLPVHDI